MVVDLARSEKDNVAAALSHPLIATVIDFKNRLGLRITDTTVRKTFSSLPSFPHIGLAEIQEAFDNWGVPSAAFRIAADHLKELPVPIIAMIDDPDPDRNATDRLVALVTAWNEAAVEISHPLMGSATLDWETFLSRWSGIMFAAGREGASAEPDYEEKLAAERHAAAAYRDTIQIIDGFLSRSECQSLIKLAEDLYSFERSPVAFHFDAGVRNKRSKTRTSYTALLSDRDDPQLARIYRRAAQRLGVEAAKIEDLQCVRYDPGQMFQAHVDGLGRTHTLLVYLNDDFEDGETIFPEIDFRVRPRTGSAILFRNVDDEGRAIAWARHAGLPPRGARKYACNIWVRAG